MTKKASLLLGLTLSFAAPSVTADQVDDLFKESWNKYQDKDYGEVIGKLRDLIALLEEKNVARAKQALPERVADWSGGDLKRESLALVGGGVAVERVYRSGKKEITVKLVKDSPLGDELVKVLNNDALVQASGKRVHTIYGQRALLESERKLLLTIEDEMILEFKGDQDTRSTDLVKFARQLDIRLLKNMK